MAGIVAGAALLLGRWESVRPRWENPVGLDRLSDRLRRVGLGLLWLEAFLMAIGSQLPTQERADRLLFVAIWAVVGGVAIGLVLVAVADSIVRLAAQRVRTAAMAQMLGRELKAFQQNQLPEEPDADDDDDDDDPERTW